MISAEAAAAPAAAAARTATGNEALRARPAG